MVLIWIYIPNNLVYLGIFVHVYVWIIITTIYAYFICKTIKISCSQETLTYFLIYFLAVLWFEIRALCFLGRHSINWATTLAVLLWWVWRLGLTFIVSCFLIKPNWKTIFLFYASCHHWNDRCVPTCPAFFSWNGVA
jgi:hypothetical protein